MPALFDSSRIAAGYATKRPYFHPSVVDRITHKTGTAHQFERALDVGCGTGLSARALASIARSVCGIDPSLAMLGYAKSSNPRLQFAASPAESLPFQSSSFGLLTAAGALDWIDAERFIPEAARVLRPKGWLAIYDIGDGRALAHSRSLWTWYEEFLARYPKPARRRVDPVSIDAESSGFAASGREDYEVEFPFTIESYADYLLTQSNVTIALQALDENSLRQWILDSLKPVFANRTEQVLFQVYILYFERLGG